MFGSKSSSSTTNLTKVNDVGFSEIGGSATSNNVEGVGNSIISTDHGAVAESFDFANQIAGVNADLVGKVTGVADNALASADSRVSQALNSVGRTASESIGAVQSAFNSDQTRLIEGAMKWVAILAIAFIGVRAFKS